MKDNNWDDLEIFTGSYSSQELYIHILKTTLRLSPTCFTYIDLNNNVLSLIYPQNRGYLHELDNVWCIN